MNKKPISYLQTDPIWRSLPYRVKGEYSTIGTAGCGPTAMAMVLATWVDPKITPKTECDWALAHGFKAKNQGTYYGYFAKRAQTLGLKCEQMNWTNLTTSKKTDNIHAQAKAQVDKGNLVIACMGPGNWTKSGHYVLVWKIEGDTIYINDPASTLSRRTQGSYSLFKQQVKYYWYVENPHPSSQPVVEEEEEDMAIIYPKLPDIPEWYRPTIKKLMEKGVLKGHSDPDPTSLEDNVLNISEDMCRVFTVLDSLGKLD